MSLFTGPDEVIGFYKGRSILVQILPKIATRCRLSNKKNWKFEFCVKNLVKMKGVLYYVA